MDAFATVADAACIALDRTTANDHGQTMHQGIRGGNRDERIGCTAAPTAWALARAASVTWFAPGRYSQL
jgi:hypothetical protein